jgi:hypothetical protein
MRRLTGKRSCCGKLVLLLLGIDLINDETGLEDPDGVMRRCDKDGGGVPRRCL